jgi:tetratricopeptide (TPR) repeat protein
MFHSIALLLAVTTPTTPDVDVWLTRLELPKAFNIQVAISPMSFGPLVPVEYYDLGFPDSAEECMRDAEERLGAGEPRARLMHQAAYGLAGLGDSERAWQGLMAAFKAYELELEAEPDDFDLRISFEIALGMAGAWSGEPIFYEKMSEQCAAAAELESGSCHALVEGARALKNRWLRARANGDENDEWLVEGLAWAEQAIEEEPGAIGGHWWRFELGFLTLVAEHGSEITQHTSDTAALVSELLEGCDQIEDAELVRSIAHLHGAIFELAALLADPEDEELREAVLPVVGEHIDGVMSRVELCEEYERWSAAVALTYWSHYCLEAEGEGEEWDRALEQAMELGLDLERCLGIALIAYEMKDMIERAEVVAARLEQEIVTDRGRGALVGYRYKTGDYTGALELASEYEGDKPEQVVQHAVLLLRTGEEEAALELLEELAGDEEEVGGHLQHALGVARAVAGRLEAAVEALEAAVDLLTDSEDAENTLNEIRERLESDRAARQGSR